MRQNPRHFFDLDSVVPLARELEEIAPRYGAHVALTGGTLYKKGDRKDADFLFYRIRQVDCIMRADLEDAIAREMEWNLEARHGWVTKWSTPTGGHIDTFYPDHNDRGPTQGKDYNGQDTDTEAGPEGDDLPF